MKEWTNKKFIKDKYNTNGLEWEFVEHINNKAIYLNRKTCSYEVVIIRDNKVSEREIKGKLVKFHPLKYPCNEDFGKFGWHFNKYENAKAKLLQIAHI